MTGSAPSFAPVAAPEWVAGAPVALVTGAAGVGIGSAITRALLEAGWRVLAVDRDFEALERLAGAAPDGGVAVLELDVTDDAAPTRALATALERYGRLDGLVNNAGVGLVRPLGEVRDEDFERLLDVDVRAVFRFCRAALPALMESRGAIVNIGSVHARRSIAGYGAYAACKAAVEALTRGFAIDYGAHGVRANCIHPGYVPSPQNDALIAAFASNPVQWTASYVRVRQLLPDAVTAAQIGRLTAFLLSPGNGAITGEALIADGGGSAMLYEREARG